MPFIDERKQRRQDDDDILEMLKIYRSAKQIGKWLAGLVVFLLGLVGLILELKRLFRK